ncbi:MAG: Gfo/Idh/MocA family oxidoreductase [Phycisphaerales bacterium]|nr:Gfo/Idh/MocA family oxidoreductase [Phycisphaerales bacterium]
MFWNAANTSLSADTQHVRYAVVGAGYIAQNAILPAFANARENSALAAIVSGEARKRGGLSRLYDVRIAVGYDDFDSLCNSGDIDAVFIALPNSLHCEFAIRAAQAGLHVLCEKPMAVTSGECRQMIRAAAQNQVKIMVAYRLHFEEANLRAIEIARGGMLGNIRYFDAAFSMQVTHGNSRTRRNLGGGPLLDLGIYCINAARYVYCDNPLEVTALCAGGFDRRFEEIDATCSVLMRFPGNRLATFTCSFDAADVSRYQIVGERGTLTVDPAFEYEAELRHILQIGDKVRERSFRRRDQFAAELTYFSDCILQHREPEPGAIEGLIDITIIEAIQRAARSGRSEALPEFQPEPKPDIDQARKMSPSRKKPFINVQRAHR